MKNISSPNTSARRHRRWTLRYQRDDTRAIMLYSALSGQAPVSLQTPAKAESFHGGGDRVVSVYFTFI